jgi:hypothetical protein
MVSDLLDSLIINVLRFKKQGKIRLYLDNSDKSNL